MSMYLNIFHPSYTPLHGYSLQALQRQCCYTRTQRLLDRAAEKERQLKVRYATFVNLLALFPYTEGIVHDWAYLNRSHWWNMKQHW